MQTFHRICIRDYVVTDYDGEVFSVERGKEYLTSGERDGEVTVFSRYWVRVPVSLFTGEVEFTKASPPPCPTCGAPRSSARNGQDAGLGTSETRNGSDGIERGPHHP